MDAFGMLVEYVAIGGTVAMLAALALMEISGGKLG